MCVVLNISVSVSLSLSLAQWVEKCTCSVHSFVVCARRYWSRQYVKYRIASENGKITGNVAAIKLSNCIMHWVPRRMGPLQSPIQCAVVQQDIQCVHRRSLMGALISGSPFMSFTGKGSPRMTATWVCPRNSQVSGAAHSEEMSVCYLPRPLSHPHAQAWKTPQEDGVDMAS